MSNLTRSVANLEENLRVTEEDKQSLLGDVSSARELCSRLEASKESVNRQLAAAELDKEQVGGGGSGRGGSESGGSERGGRNGME